MAVLMELFCETISPNASKPFVFLAQMTDKYLKGQLTRPFSFFDETV
jgi:hypothetical protein